MRSPGFSIEKGKDAKVRFLPDQGPAPAFYVDLSRGDEISPYWSETLRGKPTQRVRVPIIRNGKPETLDMAGSNFDKIREAIRAWDIERMRLARLKPLNRNSKRYRQRQARKTMRRHS